MRKYSSMLSSASAKEDSLDLRNVLFEITLLCCIVSELGTPGSCLSIALFQ